MIRKFSDFLTLSSSEVSEITQNLGNLIVCVRNCEGSEKEVAAALGPFERDLLSHWTYYTRLTIHREVGVWEKREIYTTKT
jgi:hypothetical protein